MAYNEPPDVLRINEQGELYCEDGRDVRQYLKDEMQKGVLRAGQPVNLILRRRLGVLQAHALMAMRWGA